LRAGNQESGNQILFTVSTSVLAQTIMPVFGQSLSYLKKSNGFGGFPAFTLILT